MLTTLLLLLHHHLRVRLLPRCHGFLHLRHRCGGRHPPRNLALHLHVRRRGPCHREHAHLIDPHVPMKVPAPRLRRRHRARWHGRSRGSGRCVCIARATALAAPGPRMLGATALHRTNSGLKPLAQEFAWRDPLVPSTAAVA